MGLLASWDLRSSGETAVDGVVEKSSDIVNEEGIKQLGDLFLVGEFEGTFKGNPDAFQMHWANLDDVLLLLALENTVAAASGHTCNIEEFGAVDHMIVFSSGNASTLDINLKA